MSFTLGKMMLKGVAKQGWTERERELTTSEMKINNVDGVRLDKSVNRLNTVHVAEKLVRTRENLNKENVGTCKNWKKQPIFGFITHAHQIQMD